MGFCSKLQFGSWYKQVRKVTKAVQYSDEKKVEAVTRIVQVLEVEKVALKYTIAPEHNTSSPGLTKLFQTKVSDTTVDCCRLSLEKKRMFSKVDYSAGDDPIPERVLARFPMMEHPVSIRGGVRRRVILGGVDTARHCRSFFATSKHGRGVGRGRWR